MALNEGHVEDPNGRAERDPRIERLYREAAREEPPADLDAAILAAARRAVGAGPRSLASKLRRWHVPISIAAVVVVSVSLVILVQEEEGKRDGARSVQTTPVPADRLAAPPAPRTQAPVAREALQGAETLQGAPAADSSVRRESRDDREDAARSKLAAPLQPDAAAPAPSGMGAAETPAGKRVPQPFLAEPSSRNEERAARLASPPVTAGRTASAPDAPSEVKSAAPRAEARRVAPAAGALASKPLEQDRPPVWKDFEQEPPEKWLARIEALRAQGRGAEAQEMLTEFKRRFPEHPLPSGLK